MPKRRPPEPEMAESNPAPKDPPDSEGAEEVEEAVSPELDDLLADARKFLELCKELNSQNNQDALDDLRFLSGGVNQWDAQDAAQRNLDGRPMITVNKLPTFLHQVTNNLRQNKMGVKVHPASSGANVDNARVRQGIIRHIEYDSNATVAYSTAGCSAAAIGFGYYRIVTEWVPGKFYQDMKFRRIRNPFTVHFDPLSESPDGSDAKRVLIESRMTRAEFKRKWPKAEANDTALAIGDTDLATNWMFTDEVVVAEYYRVEERPATLCLLENGETGWKDELPQEFHDLIIQEREDFKRKVMLYKITGCDKLEETEIKCYWIPVFPVYGDELDIDGKVIRSGLVRHSKDSLKMYNYWMTCATEEVALRPKTPYIGAVGQFQGFEVDWAQANRKSFPYLQYQPVTVEGNLAPAPHRQPMVDIPSGMLQMAMHANDNIKATTGLFDSSLGARGNATSGKQELAQQRQGDISNFHFLDSLQNTVKHSARCINWMIPHYLDSRRIVKIMGDDEVISAVEINAPNAINEIMNDMTGGEYTVTVESGPAYQTLRQEAAELFSDMAHNNIELMKIAGDLIIGEMDIPGAQKIAARIKKSIPPQLTEGENPEDRNSVDGKLEQIGQIKQQIDMQQQQMEEQAQMLAEMEQKAKDATIKAREAQTKVDVDTIALEADRQVFKAEVARLAAEMKLASQPEGEKTEEVKVVMTENGPMPFEEWKVRFENTTKFAIVEVQEAGKVKAAAANANATKGEDGTVIDEQGTPQISPGLAAVVEAMNQNIAVLTQGQENIAAQLAKPPRKRTAKKLADGSFLMEEIE